MNTYAVRRTNPTSKWAYRIVRTRPEGGTHKLSIKFETAERAQAYMEKHAANLDRFC